MQEVPDLFDPVKARLLAQRARRMGRETFLLDHAVADLCERLAPILRAFPEALDAGTPDGAFGKALKESGRIGAATFVEEGADLPANPFPLVLSGMVLHRENDLPGRLIQLRRALVPDGLFIAAFPGGETLKELRAVLLSAEAEESGSASLRVFPMVDVRSAGQLLQRAGFALPVSDSETLTLRYPGLFALVRDLRAMGETAGLLKRQAAPLARSVILRAAELYQERYGDPDGKIRATVELVWIMGWAPHPRQQQPLKPGSAKLRLADVLKSRQEG